MPHVVAECECHIPKYQLIKFSAGTGDRGGEVLQTEPLGADESVASMAQAATFICLVDKKDY